MKAIKQPDGHSVEYDYNGNWLSQIKYTNERYVTFQNNENNVTVKYGGLINKQETSFIIANNKVTEVIEKSTSGCIGKTVRYSHTEDKITTVEYDADEIETTQGTSYLDRKINYYFDDIGFVINACSFMMNA